MTQNYWQPAGLSALQLALLNVVKKRIEGDEAGMYSGLNLFALTTGNKDIIAESKKISKQIADELQIKMAASGITLGEHYWQNIDNIDWLRKKNDEYYEKIMLLCDTYGITVKHPKEIESNKPKDSSQLFEA